jgi:hypothetical protein
MAKVQSIWLVVTIVVAGLFAMWYVKKNCPHKEGMTGFGVTSGLAFNNRTAYCQPGNEAQGGSWSGGCFLPHRVIV